MSRLLAVPNHCGMSLRNTHLYRLEYVHTDLALLSEYEKSPVLEIHSGDSFTSFHSVDSVYSFTCPWVHSVHSCTSLDPFIHSIPPCTLTSSHCLNATRRPHEIYGTPFFLHFYRVFHTDRHKRKQHCSASRSDNTNLKKVLWSLNTPIFHASRFTFTKKLLWLLHKSKLKFWNCKMTFLRNLGSDHSYCFFHAISKRLELESWDWSHL